MVRKQRRFTSLFTKKQRRSGLGVEQLEPRVLMTSSLGLFSLRDFLASSLERTLHAASPFSLLAAPRSIALASPRVNSAAAPDSLDLAPSSADAGPDAPLIPSVITPTGTSWHQTAGLTPPPTVIVGWFTDSVPGTLADYGVTVINWGDGSGQNTPTSLIKNGNTFTATASHAYTSPGVYKVTVRILKFTTMPPTQVDFNSTAQLDTGVLPADTPPTSSGCSCSGDGGLDGSAPGADGGDPKALDKSSGQTRYSDGVVNLPLQDASSDGFGKSMGQTRLWSNGAGVR
ncbi:MAG: hypothetical protein ACJ8FY_28070 [Gemmataceae bacterium]